MYLYAEVCSLLCAVAESHGGNHIALGSDAHTGTSALTALLVNLLPQHHFAALHLVAFGVALDFLHDALNLLQLQVDDVVHDALGQSHMLAEKVEVKVGILGEGIYHV